MKWNNTEVCPGNGAILYLTTNGKLGVFKEGKVKDQKDWDWLVSKYSIKYWISQCDIINDIDFIKEEAELWEWWREECKRRALETPRDIKDDLPF